MPRSARVFGEGEGPDAKGAEPGGRKHEALDQQALTAHLCSAKDPNSLQLWPSTCSARISGKIGALQSHFSFTCLISWDSIEIFLKVNTCCLLPKSFKLLVWSLEVWTFRIIVSWEFKIHLRDHLVHLPRVGDHSPVAC